MNTNEQGFIHYANDPFIAACGSDACNQKTTTIRTQVTCPWCKDVIKPDPALTAALKRAEQAESERDAAKKLAEELNMERDAVDAKVAACVQIIMNVTGDGCYCEEIKHQRRKCVVCETRHAFASLPARAAKIQGVLTAVGKMADSCRGDNPDLLAVGSNAVHVFNAYRAFKAVGNG